MPIESFLVLADLGWIWKMNCNYNIYILEEFVLLASHRRAWLVG